MERWRADALLVGETSALVELNKQVRNDAISALDELEQRERTVAEREARCDQHERELAATAARLSDEIGRAAEMWDRLEQASADQERQAEEPLPAPPSEPDDPPPGADAASPGDPDEPPDDPDTLPEPPGEADDTHVPSGDFHDLPAKDPEQEGHPQPDARGEFLRRRDQAEFPDPQLPRPPEDHPQPISAGLDWE
jgi:hypothetical protein